MTYQSSPGTSTWLMSMFPRRRHLGYCLPTYVSAGAVLHHTVVDARTRFVVPTKAVDFPVATSNADATAAVIYTRVITFHKVADVSFDAFTHIAERMERGFRAAVDVFPFVSGELTSLAAGDYQIDAPIKGASFTIQYAPSISIAELEINNFNNAAIPMCLTAPGWLVGSGDPLVQAHVTRLGDGIAVALAMHHVLGDARATFNFLGAWADFSRVGELVSVDPPVIDRSNLTPSKGAIPIGQHEEFKIARPSDSVASPAAVPEIVSEYLHFTSESLARLKEDAARTNPAAQMEGGSWISMNDALTALFWRAYTRARGLGRGEERGGEIPTVCSFACDCRSRLEPHLPPSYFGNVNFLVYTKTSVGGLLGRSLGEAAGEIRAATARNNNAHVRSALAYIEAAGDKSTVKLSPAFFLGNDIVLSNWSKFPLLEQDWGFGKPCAVRIPSSNIDGFCLILPACDGGVDVLAGLRADHWKSFMCDPELLTYTRVPRTLEA